MKMIKTWGVGRKDYSVNIEESVIPIARSHQYRAFSTIEADLTPYDWMTIDMEAIFGLIVVYALPPAPPYYNYSEYTAEVEFDANVLIKAYWGMCNPDIGVFDEKQCKYGYGKVKFIFPKGMIITTEEYPPWRPAIAFLPGGYIIKEMMSFIQERMPPKRIEV